MISMGAECETTKYTISLATHCFPPGLPIPVYSDIPLIRSRDFVGTLINSYHNSIVKGTVWTGCSHFAQSNLIEMHICCVPLKKHYF